MDCLGWAKQVHIFPISVVTGSSTEARSTQPQATEPAWYLDTITVLIRFYLTVLSFKLSGDVLLTSISLYLYSLSPNQFFFFNFLLGGVKFYNASSISFALFSYIFPQFFFWDLSICFYFWVFFSSLLLFTFLFASQKLLKMSNLGIMFSTRYVEQILLNCQIDLNLKTKFIIFLVFILSPSIFLVFPMCYMDILYLPQICHCFGSQIVSIL